MEKILTYKGYKLMRQNDIIYYGDMSDDFIIMMQIMSHKKVDSVDVADKVSLMLLSTNESLPFIERIVKRADKDGMYTALDVAYIWLNRALTKKA